MIKKFFVLLALPVFLSTLAPSVVRADPTDYNELKTAAVSEFLSEANDANSALGKQLLEINQKSIDGKNQKGTLSLPVKKEDLQVVLLSGYVQDAPWHFADKTDDLCTATGDFATFQVLVPVNTNVHYAQDFTTISYIVKTHVELTAKILKDKDWAHCQDVTFDIPGRFSDVHSEIVVSHAHYEKTNDDL